VGAARDFFIYTLTWLLTACPKISLCGFIKCDCLCFCIQNRTLCLSAYTFIKIKNHQKVPYDNVLQTLLTWHKIGICLNDEQNIYV